MERIIELEESIKEYRTARKDAKNSLLQAEFKNLLHSLFSCLDMLIKEQKANRELGKHDRIKFISFFHLLSSGYTNSGEIAIGMSNSMLYLDDNFTCAYWKPPFVYESIDEDMGEVKRILCQKFIRIEEYELLQLKQTLLLDDWAVFSKSIDRLAEGISEQILNSPLLFADEVELLYGDYMDRLDVAAKINTKGRIRNE